MDLNSHVALHLDAMTHGETTHTRNNDKTFMQSRVMHTDRRHHNGDWPEWVIMTGHMENCVSMNYVELHNNTNLIKNALIVHMGDLATKTIECGVFIKRNF